MSISRPIFASVFPLALLCTRLSQLQRQFQLFSIFHAFIYRIPQPKRQSYPSAISHAFTTRVQLIQFRFRALSLLHCPPTRSGSESMKMTHAQICCYQNSARSLPPPNGPQLKLPLSQRNIVRPSEPIACSGPTTAFAYPTLPPPPSTAPSSSSSYPVASACSCFKPFIHLQWQAIWAVIKLSIGCVSGSCSPGCIHL